MVALRVGRFVRSQLYVKDFFDWTVLPKKLSRLSSR